MTWKKCWFPLVHVTTGRFLKAFKCCLQNQQVLRAAPWVCVPACSHTVRGLWLSKRIPVADKSNKTGNYLWTVYNIVDVALHMQCLCVLVINPHEKGCCLSPTNTDADGGLRSQDWPGTGMQFIMPGLSDSKFKCNLELFNYWVISPLPSSFPFVVLQPSDATYKYFQASMALSWS